MRGEERAVDKHVHREVGSTAKPLGLAHRHLERARLTKFGRRPRQPRLGPAGSHQRGHAAGLVAVGGRLVVEGRQGVERGVPRVILGLVDAPKGV